jgi:hypothetical protein
VTAEEPSPIVHKASAGQCTAPAMVKNGLLIRTNQSGMPLLFRGASFGKGSSTAGARFSSFPSTPRFFLDFIIQSVRLLLNKKKKQMNK